MQEQNQEFEQELDLRKHIEIILKRKKLILTIFFISIIASAAISFVMPKNYEVLMLVEPPSVAQSSSGGSVFVDSPLNVKAIVDAGAFDSKIAKGLELDPHKTKIRPKVSLPKDSTILKIGLDEPEKKIGIGVKILNQLFVEISSYYKNVIELKKDDIDRRVAGVSNRIKNESNSIKLNEESLKIVEAREKELMDELKDTKANTEQLLIKRNVLLERKAPADDISSLLYTNTIQQNITYFNQLNNQLAEIRTKKESIVNAIKTLQNAINDSSLEIEKLKADKEAISNIKLVKEPQASFDPVGASKRKTVALAGLVSLILGTFLAFFMEYWQDSKK
jgi:uncharacterized protein involved in exopolysaccharide biosynthesis